MFHEIASFHPPYPVVQARLLPDAQHVLYETGGRNRALWRGELKDPDKPRKLEADAPGWVHLVLSSDGRFAVLAGKDKTLWNWDLLQIGQSRRLRSGGTDVTAITLSPDNQLVACVRGGAIQLCDAITGDKGTKKVFAGKIGSRTDLIAFCPDGRRIASTHADRTVRIWDVKTGREIGHAEPGKLVTGLSVFPDGGRVLTSFSDRMIGTWDLETGKQLRQLPGFGASIAVSTDGCRALIGGGNLMQLWDPETGEELRRVDHQRTVKYVAFSSDDRQAVSGTDESVRVWSLPPGRPLAEQNAVVEVAQFPAHEGVISSVVVSPDGRRVLAAGWPNFMRLWDRETGQLIHSFSQDGKEIRSVAFSPAGNRALSGGDDGVVRLWDLASGEHREFHGHVDNVLSVAFSPDGRLAYSAGGGIFRDGWHDGTDFAVRVWELETGQQLRSLEGHKGMVWSVAVSSDGRLVLSGGNDAIPILWDARTGRVVHRFQGHTDRVDCVAFLPDGRRALSSGLDGTIRLWDVESGQEVLRHFKGTTGRNGWLAISPDGHRLFSADGGGRRLRYWNLDTGKLIQELKWGEFARLSGSFTPDGRYANWGGWDGITLRMNLSLGGCSWPGRSYQPRRSST